jgi:DNA invertase Pin-like site-specific DNA recombinase
MSNKVVRCAIYTRKSSEEGLEQSFNSLEAQREACCAYVLSQRHEGWTALNDRYDDGGFSGGTMERPALQQLLADILAGKINTVVVYKVDRLTRSLNDFSKIIEVFDSHGVSFVSVTQAFNTTTSMGRLTLNVLLSFAQFEREVTGERIRDKVAASKKKGMWMGGVIPLGYDCLDRKLIVNPKDANTVIEMFRKYLRLGSVMKLKRHLEKEQILSKVRTSKDGNTSGGATYSRGALYHLLNNRVYIGEIVHRGQSYPGQHEAIVQQELWNQVTARMQANTQAHRTKNRQSTSSLLTGIVFDTSGVRFSPTYTFKAGKRYRYYTSQATIQKTGKGPGVTRFPAHELENLVTSQVHSFLASRNQITDGLEASPETDLIAERSADMAKRWPQLDTSKQHHFVRSVVRRVVVGKTAIWIDVDRANLMETLLVRKPELIATAGEHGHDIVKLTAEFQALRRGNELRISGPKDSTYEAVQIPSLVKAIARARGWYERIISGEIGTVSELAQKAGLDSTYVKHILQCAVLSPQITEQILSGKHRRNLTLQDLLQNVPIAWQEQDKLLQ